MIQQLSAVWIVVRFILWYRSLVIATLNLMEAQMTHNTEPSFGTVGINEFLDVIDVGLLAGKGIFASLKDDGKITATDYVNFFPAVMQAPDALTGITSVPAELADLQVEEVAILEKHILSRVPEVGSKWMEVASASFQIGAGIVKLLKALKTA